MLGKVPDTRSVARIRVTLFVGMQNLLMQVRAAL